MTKGKGDRVVLNPYLEVPLPHVSPFRLLPLPLQANHNPALGIASIINCPWFSTASGFNLPHIDLSSNHLRVKLDIMVIHSK